MVANHCGCTKYRGIVANVVNLIYVYFTQIYKKEFEGQWIVNSMQKNIWCGYYTPIKLLNKKRKRKESRVEGKPRWEWVGTWSPFHQCGGGLAHTVPHCAHVCAHTYVKQTVCVLGAEGWGWERGGTASWGTTRLNKIKQASLMQDFWETLQRPCAEWTSREDSQAELPKFLWSSNSVWNISHRLMKTSNKQRTDWLRGVTAQMGWGSKTAKAISPMNLNNQPHAKCPSNLRSLLL